MADSAQRRAEIRPVGRTGVTGGTIVKQNNKRAPSVRQIVIPLLYAVALAATVMLLLSPGDAVRVAEEHRSLDLNQELTNGANNYLSDLLEDIYYIKRKYVIEDDALFGPEPDQSCFCQDDGESLSDAMNKALIYGLYNPGESVFNSEIKTFNDVKPRYYLDETIFSILWKEEIGDCLINFAEVYIADSSQMRRKLSGDAFGAGVRCTSSHLAADANAVLAISGDYYGYRMEGVSVYNRQIMRNTPGRLDICYINDKGDMIFERQASSADNDGREKFVKDNNIVFSLAFGPALIIDGQPQEWDWNYPVGQPNGNYARSAISQIGHLHYLLCTIDGGIDNRVGTTVKKMQKLLMDRNCRSTYTIDGGQTATIVFNGEVFNRVGYGSEREVSDIIYFATALDS